jgi:3-ketosteroid 9alpha-monooxygenase subunit B
MTIVQPERPAVPDHDQVLRAHGYHPLRVKRIIQETADTRSFVLDVPEELGETFRYQPGQFCTFRVHIGDDEHLRSYSMSSAPETDADLTVTVKRVAGGLVSNWLLDNVSEGDVLETTKPAGVFCAQDDERPMVAFCGGSGVTPVMSIVKSLLARTQRPVRVLYANRDGDSVIFHDELSELAARQPGQLYVHHHLDVDAGFLDADAIGEFIAGTVDADVYICGPGPFMDLVEMTLLAVGVDADHIFIERFVNAGQAMHSATDPVDVAPVGTDPEVPEAVTVILKGTRHTIAYQPGDTLLETARRGALQAPFSCESGNCATCMALMSEGTATMRANNALTPEEVDEGWVLTCQALPHGPTVTVEYESF